MTYCFDLLSFSDSRSTLSGKDQVVSSLLSHRTLEKLVISLAKSWKRRGTGRNPSSPGKRNLRVRRVERIEIRLLALQQAAKAIEALKEERNTRR
jgi:hypothetical protein